MQIEEKYLKDLQDFLIQFPNEKSYWQYNIDIKWPDGYVCSQYNSSKWWLMSKNKIHCSGYEKEFPITNGTIYHKSSKPLVLWFHIMWWVINQKTRVNAYNLMDFMGFGYYEAAWMWIHRLCRAIVRKSQDRLSGVVEVDETCIESEEKEKLKKGRCTEEKSLVVVATECIEKNREAEN